MSEIEKLYENANIEKHFAYYECHRGRSSIRKCPTYYDERDKGCLYCSYENRMKEVYEYPPFTAEKQLELVKWLFNSIRLLCLAPLQHSENFENSLAELVNNLWQDLTTEEKQQIKEILSE